MFLGRSEDGGVKLLVFEDIYTRKYISLVDFFLTGDNISVIYNYMYVDVCTHSVRRKFDLESDYKKDVFPILVDRRKEIWPNGLKIPVISKRKDLQGYDKSVFPAKGNQSLLKSCLILF